MSTYPFAPQPPRQNRLPTIVRIVSVKWNKRQTRQVVVEVIPGPALLKPRRKL